MQEKYVVEQSVNQERNFGDPLSPVSDDAISSRVVRAAVSLQARSPRPISGRYEGDLTAPIGGRDLLDLRVDIDQRYANSPVMNRLSGDFFQVNRLNLPGSPPRTWRVYRESWLVQSPQVAWGQNEVIITGTVLFWEGIHPPTNIKVRIPWDQSGAIGSAEATFSHQAGVATSYTCARMSDCFRSLNLEVNVCRSVSPDAIITPSLPGYDTFSHNNRPGNLARRLLTVEEAYREAGVCLEIRPDSAIIDDSAADFESWSDAELHNAMENHFSQIRGSWPQWEMWGILAGAYDDDLVGGIMFDAAAAPNDAGNSPERQGFAVFRKHPWFNDLPAGQPANQAQADALRQFLYTWIHEAGHAFNFLHSWDKNRPNALSWMNYSWRYDINNGTDSFWANFDFRFDDEELIHLRHGKRSSVIMGGDPWASGGHLESPPGAEYLKAPPGALSHAEGTVPVELLIRSKEYFEFLEPVTVELRIRNLVPDLPLYLDTNLNPDFGATVIYIRRPDGRIVEYSPIMCKLAVTKSRTLLPKTPRTTEGTDRYSDSVFLSYGRYGYYFDQPGEYLIRALYQGPGDLLIPSNIHRVRVGMPVNVEEDRLAQDFFSYEAGMSLYLRGSQSRHLRKGMDVLEEMADRYKGTMRGARVAHRIAPSIANPFFDVQDGETIEAESITSLADARSGKGRASETRHVQHMIRTHKGDPKKALEITDSALDVYRDTKTKPMNIPYARLVELRSELLASLGQTGKAIDELSTLQDDLSKRGVNPPVLAAIGNRIEGYNQADALTRGSESRGSSKKSMTKSGTRKTKKKT